MTHVSESFWEEGVGGELWGNWIEGRGMGGGGTIVEKFLT